MGRETSTHSIADSRRVSEENSYRQRRKQRDVFSAAAQGIAGYAGMVDQKLGSIQCWVCRFTGGVDIDHLTDDRCRVGVIS